MLDKLQSHTQCNWSKKKKWQNCIVKKFSKKLKKHKIKNLNRLIILCHQKLVDMASKISFKMKWRINFFTSKLKTEKKKFPKLLKNLSLIY